MGASEWREGKHDEAHRESVGRVSGLEDVLSGANRR